MGFGTLPSITDLTAQSYPNVYYPNKFSNTSKCQQDQIKTASWPCCFCTSKYGYGGGRAADGSQWQESKTSRNGTHKQQPRYPSHDQFSTDDKGTVDNSAKPRNWWSDDSSWELEEDDDDDDENETGFGFSESSFGFYSIFKVLRGFGWMLPAIGISMLLGTRTDTFFMALVLPLAQSAASMAFDALWGASTGSMRPKTRYRKRGFRGAARTSQTKYRREPNRKTAKSTEDYQSWVAANRGSTEKGEGTKRAFGGWDDLDRSWSDEEIPKPAPAEEKRQSNEGKLSRRRRNKSASPLVRMLVALFPFLGFLTKLL